MRVRASGRRGVGARAGWRKNTGREGERKREGEDRVRDPIAKRKGPESKVEGSVREKQKTEEGGCKRQGVGTEKDQGQD